MPLDTMSIKKKLLAVFAVSVFFLGWEQLRPWRRDQPRVREGFWLDGFYMFFNFFLFGLLGYTALSDVAAVAFTDALAAVGVTNLVALEVGGWPVWGQLLLMFVLRDFVQYWVHRLLHVVEPLWRVHQVHHSVRQMGFAAHLRFHPAETVLYRTLEYVPLAMVGFGVQDFFVVHAVAITIGHWNHSNIRLPIGPLRYVVNSPELHIWHHAKELPEGSRGVSYALSLAIWDVLFGTYYLPSDGRDIALGFEDVERYPRRFLGQLIDPFRRRRGAPPDR